MGAGEPAHHDAAREAGRNPADLRRIAQIVETIGGVSDNTTLRTGAAPLRADAQQWASEIARLAVEQPFTGLVFWPEHQSIEQIELFAGEVAPTARALISEKGPLRRSRGRGRRDAPINGDLQPRQWSDPARHHGKHRRTARGRSPLADGSSPAIDQDRQPVNFQK